MGVYGWGVTSENGANLADKLLELEVPIVSDSVCASAMSSVSIGITSDMLCAGGEDGNSYDIALFKLAESVDLDVWSPACLPDQGADYTGQNGWVYGWGVTSENGANLADKLLELEVPIVS